MLPVAVWEPASGREAKAYRLNRHVTTKRSLSPGIEAQERRGTNHEKRLECYVAVAR